MQRPGERGTIVDAPVNTIDWSENAFKRSSCGTSSGTSAARVGWSKLRAAPWRKASTTTIQTATTWSRVSTPRRAANPMQRVWVVSSRRRLSTRSATAPPKSENAKKASACARETAAERERRPVAEIEHEQRLRHDLHPGADGRAHEAEPEQPEVAVAKRLEGPGGSQGTSTARKRTRFSMTLVNASSAW